MPELLTMGETMALFAPQGRGPLRYLPDYRMKIAGAESNLAIGVAKLGHAAGWISRLGEDEFGQFVRNSVRAEGVDTAAVTFDASRATGIMFKEMTGSGETRVYYYRDGSAASALTARDLAPESFAGARIVHLTGITPVLSESCAEAVRRAVELARAAGALISFDPNIRRKLWKGRDFTAELRALTLQADIVLTGLDEARALFGAQTPDEAMDAVFHAGRARYVAVKNGADGAYAATRAARCRVLPHPCNRVDPVGAGDAFGAGFLCGLLEDRPLEECGRMGSIAGALATETTGDIEGYPSRRQMQSMLDGADVVYR